MLGALLDNGLQARLGVAARRVAEAGIAVVAVIGVVAALVAIGNPVSYANDKWDEFTDLEGVSHRVHRLISVGGQRYDLWRVALSEFDSQPLVGVEELPVRLLPRRRTDRNLSDPHSLPFALLSGNRRGAPLPRFPGRDRSRDRPLRPLLPARSGSSPGWPQAALRSSARR